MVGITFAIGNFMKKSDYDPNEDNVIAKAQLDVDMMDKATYDTDVNGVVETCEHIEQGQIKKKKTDTLKQSHDAQASHATDAPNGDVYEELKRITFTTGLVGAIRIKWTCQNSSSGAVVQGYSKLVDKDGSIIGSVHDNGHTNTTTHTYTEDIDAADFAASEYIAVQAKNVQDVIGSNIHVTNFRIYYDENNEDFVNT